MGTCLTTGGGPQKLDIFETTLQSSTLVETHSATKGIQEWMKRGSFANYCCEHSLDVFFSPPFYFTQAVFSPLVPSYWEGYISQAGLDGWSGEEQCRAGRWQSDSSLHVWCYTALLWLYTQCSQRISVSFNYMVFVRQKFQTCKISASFYPVWIESRFLFLSFNLLTKQTCWLIPRDKLCQIAFLLCLTKAAGNYASVTQVKVRSM